MNETQTKTLKIGTVLKNGDWRYRIVKVLGQGGFGITYLATGEVMVGNVTTEATFAIKEHFPTTYASRNESEVAPAKGKESDYLRSKSDFISEARKLHALGTQNENIVKVNEVFEENGTAYYVMQYINGESLTSYVKSRGKIPYAEAIILLLPILNAVDFLHKSRINHLDIKPDNIMLHDSIDGKTPVLIDFGLSVHFKKNGDKTSPKDVMGVSEGYSPLEQYAGIKEFNPAADIYSLAATLLYVLTGATPKGAADLRTSEVRSALSSIVPPQQLDGICKALNKSYEDRTSSVSSFKIDLGISGNAGSDTIVINHREERKKKTFYTIIGVLAAVAVVSLSILIIKSNRPAHKPDGPIAETHTLPLDTLTPVTPDPESEQAKDTLSAPAPVQIEEPIDTVKPQPPTQPPTQTTQTNANSDTYIGSLNLGYGTWKGRIKKGKPHGKGTLSFTRTHTVDRHSSVEANPGDYLVANYENGNLISGKLYDSNGTLLKTVIP